MKIRTGFVSNSSSSSFIVTPNQDIPNIFELGKKMLAIRNNDWVYNEMNEDYATIYNTELNKINRAIDLGIQHNTPIAFSTTNYDTYIRLDQRHKMVVDTCNNHNWDNLGDITTVDFNGEDELDPRPNEVFFWFIKEGIVGKPLTKEEWAIFKNKLPIQTDSWPMCWKNASHYDTLVKSIENEIVCVDCYYQEKKSDMILKPAIQLRIANAARIKKPLRLRG